MNNNIDTVTAIKPVTTVIIITPEIAKRWLQHNTNNRPVARIIVDKYKRDMEAGLWHFTNAGIAYDINGELIDGQHRLIAISELPSGTGIAMNVTRGLAPEAKYFIDQGRKRTPGNQLAMSGVKNYNHVAAGAKFFLVWQTGVMFRDNKQAQLITAPQIQEWVSEHPELVELSNRSHSVLIKNDAQPSVARAAFWAFAKIDPQQADLFFRKLSTGAGLDSGNPILALRQRLETDRRAKRARPAREQLGMVISTWNAWRSGRSLLSTPVKAWTAQTFPVPK